MPTAAIVINTALRVACVQRTWPNSTSMTAKGTRKKQAFTIAFETSAEYAVWIAYRTTVAARARYNQIAAGQSARLRVDASAGGCPSTRRVGSLRRGG